MNHRSIIAGSCLVTELARELLASPEQLLQTHVVLPTQRLHIYLVQELVRLQNGTSRLPRLWTWDHFLQELVVDNVSKDLVMVSSQAELIMKHVLLHRQQRLADRILNTNSRHAHELVHLAGELVKAGVQQSSRQALQDYLERDWRRSADVYEGLSNRINDVFDCLNEFNQVLREHHWSTAEESRSQAVAAWLDQPSDQQIATIPKGSIVIAGLTSLPGLESKLFSKLATYDHVSIWLDEAPPFSGSSPLGELRSLAGLSASHAKHDAWAAGVKAIFGAPDVTHEVTHTLTRIRMLMDSGIPAHEIGVIVPDETSHGPAFKALADKLGIPVNIPLATPWAASSIGRWLRLVTSITSDNSVHTIGQYFLHPMTQKLFGAPDSFEDIKLQRSLKSFPDIDRPPTKLLGYLRQEFSSEDAEYLVRAFTWCITAQASDMDGARTELLSAVEKLRSTDVKSLSPRDVSTWDILCQSIDQVSALHPLRGFKATDWASYLADIYQTASRQSIRDTGEPLYGLQIIGLTEARYVPFAAVFIVGCVEGSFPHALPRDSLIDNSMRRVMGLPGWNDLEALEDTTFHLLTSRIPHVELSFAHADADTPTIRSRWIEQLTLRLTPIEVEISNAYDFIKCDQETATNISSIEVTSLAEGLASDHETLTATTSASRLRNLIWCPYRYLLDARCIETIELPEDRAQVTAGVLLHKVLESFFKIESLPGLPPHLNLSGCPEHPANFVTWAHDRLDALAARIIPRELARTPQFQHMTGKGWQQVAEFWGRLFQAGWHPKHVSTEVKIGNPTAIKFKINGRDIEIHGTIDAVHAQSNGPRLLTDYKTSSVPGSTAIAEGLEPQLILYAEALEQSSPQDDHQKTERLQNSAVAYYSLSTGKASYAAIGQRAKDIFFKNNLITSYSRFSDMEDAVRAVRGRWSDRLSTIAQSSAFAADPSDCGYCSYQGICRKDDPRYRDRIHQQKIAKPSLRNPKGSEHTQEDVAE